MCIRDSHSGIYYVPGSKKAITCANGRKELVAFAKEHGVKHDVCGKIIVAMEADELPRLEKIHQRGIANGIEDLKLITAEEIKGIEPYCTGICLLYTSDAADERSSVDLGGRRIINKNTTNEM